MYTLHIAILAFTNIWRMDGFAICILIAQVLCLSHLDSVYSFARNSPHIGAIMPTSRNRPPSMGEGHHVHGLQPLRQKVVVILGPTATGKTDASIEVALNLKQYNIAAEIINADSMQVYQGFDIGTAKPTPQQMQKVKHHLFGFIEPTKEYNAATYVQTCSKVIDSLHSDGVLPIVVGGTNMYIEGLIWPSVIDMPRTVTDDVHETYQGTTPPYYILNPKIIEYTTEELYDKLVALDPERAAMLHQNDRKRIARSLDVLQLYGKKHSELIKKRNQERNKIGAKYDAIIFAMQCEGERHKALIKKRTQYMLQNGIIDECLDLMKIIGIPVKLGLCRPCPESDKTLDIRKGICQSIAYKELIPILKQSMERETTPSDETLELCITALEKATWQYTRRQNTWIRNRFRSEPGIKVVHLDTTDVTNWKSAIIDTIISEILVWHSNIVMRQQDIE